MSNWEKVEKDIERGPFGLFKWIAIAVVLIFILFGVLRSVGLIGSTAVERAVLKNSFQYKEGMAQRGAILEANLAEIEASLIKHPENRRQLLAQKKVLEAQLRAIAINE